MYILEILIFRRETNDSGSNFKLNNEDFGLDIMNVNEIIRMQPLTAMPNTSDYVRVSQISGGKLFL
jgi:hypothetical protein